MLRKIEWNTPITGKALEKIDQQVTPDLVKMAVMFAQVTGEVMYKEAQERCKKVNQPCLPEDNFVQVAFREKLRAMLGIRSGSVDAMTFNEWYKLHSQELSSFLD